MQAAWAGWWKKKQSDRLCPLLHVCRQLCCQTHSFCGMMEAFSTGCNMIHTQSVGRSQEGEGVGCCSLSALGTQQDSIRASNQSFIRG